MEHGVPHQIVTPRGTIYFNTYTAADYWRLNDIQGADGAQLSREVVQLAQRDGAFVPDGFFGALYPSFSGDIVANTAPQLVTRRAMADTLRGNLYSLKDANGTWQWTPSADTSAAAANLIANGGFETNTAGWAAESTETLTRITSDFYNGVASLQLSAAPVAGNLRGVYANAIASPVIGDVYTVSCYMKALNAGTIGKTVSIQPWDGTAALGPATLTALTGSWQLFTNTLTVVRTTPISLYIGKATGAASTDVIGLDAVKLETGAKWGQPGRKWGDPGNITVSSTVAVAVAGTLQRTVRLAQAAQVVQGIRLDRFQFGLVAADPLAYSSVLQTSPNLAINGATVAINNGGNAPSKPLLRIFGAVTNPSITHVPTGLVVAFNNLTIADGSYVDVDTALLTVLLSTDGTSKVGGINRAASTFWTLAPGSQTVSAAGTSVGANAKVQVLWRDAWVA